MSSQTHQELAEHLYTIVAIVVCEGFKVILIEKIDFPTGKNVGSFAYWGEDGNNGIALTEPAGSKCYKESSTFLLKCATF